MARGILWLATMLGVIGAVVMVGVWASEQSEALELANIFSLNPRKLPAPPLTLGGAGFIFAFAAYLGQGFVEDDDERSKR